MEIITTQIVWMLFGILMIMNFLNANEHGIAASERHWIVEGNAESYQSIYFRNVIASNCK